MRSLLIGAVMATMAFSGCGGDDKPTAPPSGSCCLTNRTCTLTTQASCTGTWTLHGVCSPNPCAYPPQTSAANVIANLQVAYGERKIDEYRKLFAEDFVFVFSPRDPIDPNHPLPPHWSLVEELSVTGNMFSSEFVIKIELRSYTLGVPERVDSLNYGPRAWKVRMDQANLLVYTRKEDGTLLTLFVDGATEVFYFREEPGNPSPTDGRPTWYIFRWEDRPIGGGKTEFASWGAVKGLFR